MDELHLLHGCCRALPPTPSPSPSPSPKPQKEEKPGKHDKPGKHEKDPPVVENVDANVNVKVVIEPNVKPVEVTRFDVTLVNNVTAADNKEKKGTKEKADKEKGDAFIMGSLGGPFKPTDKKDDK
jgi:hypothetical protein